MPEAGNPQAFNRFAYSLSNPLKYVDPTGHRPCDSAWGCDDQDLTDSSALYNSPLYDNILWDQLDPEEQALILRAGGDETTWNAERVYGNARNVEGTLQDPAMLIPVAGGVRIAIKTVRYLVGLATAACADGDCGNELQAAEQTGRTLLDSVSKLDARTALRTGIEGLSNGQVQKALEVLRSGRIDSVSMTALDNGIRIAIERPGAIDGFQRLIYTLDASGKTVGLLQEVYNAAGELIHVHDKLNNIIIK